MMKDEKIEVEEIRKEVIRNLSGMSEIKPDECENLYKNECWGCDKCSKKQRKIINKAHASYQLSELLNVLEQLDDENE